jgi:hypothetical protein
MSRMSVRQMLGLLPKTIVRLAAILPRLVPGQIGVQSDDSDGQRRELGSRTIGFGGGDKDLRMRRPSDTARPALRLLLKRPPENTDQNTCSLSQNDTIYSWAILRFTSKFSNSVISSSF